MNLDYKNLLPQDFAPNSRVWIYQSNQLFGMSEALQIEELLTHFTANWKSHGIPVKGFGTLLFGQFIILMADENATGVSGCSTDSSVKLIKEIENLYKVNMFDRLSLAFIIKDKVELLPLSQVQYALDNNFITPNTIFFQNGIQTNTELEKNWMIPISESWVAKRLNLPLQKA